LRFSGQAFRSKLAACSTCRTNQVYRRPAVERLSQEDRTSINQFVATAVAEKVSALQTAKYFADRQGRADF
jgi:hypothetical protein